MSNIAVRLDQVSKRFQKGEMFDSIRDLVPGLARRVFSGSRPTTNDFWALRDVSFEIPRGQAFGIIGHNGAGKSTMLKLLSRIMKPTHGSIEMNGRLSALIEVAAGFHQDLTGRENIYLNGTILGMNRKEVARKFDEIVDFSGLGEFLDTPVKRYSSGMYARLGFAVAAHVDPEVLIVDEVLSVGDFLFQDKCVRRMQSIIRGGATVLFVSHNLRAVTELCDRSVLLEHGRVVRLGPTDEVVRDYLQRASRATPAEDAEVPVYVSDVRVRGQNGESVSFTSGDTMWVDVRLTARTAVEKLAVVLDIKDDSFYNVADTSTERLGHGNFSLAAGDSFECSFRLKVNMAHGTFHLCPTIYRYDIQKAYHTLSPGATIYVSSQTGVRGAVNCHPVVERQTVAKSGQPTSEGTLQLDQPDAARRQAICK